jgi:hypothetical protein
LSWETQGRLPNFSRIVVLLTRLSSYSLRARSLSVVSTLLGPQLALMILGAALATLFGPFGNPDGYEALVTGMTFVSATGFIWPTRPDPRS